MYNSVDMSNTLYNFSNHHSSIDGNMSGEAQLTNRSNFLPKLIVGGGVTGN
jgi:hypothetical protein